MDLAVLQHFHCGGTLAALALDKLIGHQVIIMVITGTFSLLQAAAQLQ